MRSSFPRAYVRDFHDVINPVSVPENLLQVLGFAPSAGGGTSGGSSGSFVLSPGYQAIESGQVPQALPGQPHDGSPPALASPQAIAAPPFSASAIPQNPLPSTAPSSSQQAGPSTESALSTPTLSSSVQISATTTTLSEGTLSPSSPLSSAAPQTLSGNAAPVPTSSILPSSTSNPATSSTPAAAITSSTNSHGTSFWAGIALLSIAGVATLITLFVWWLRVRERTHRRPWESRWPWGRTESYKFPEDSMPSSSGPYASLWQPQGYHGDVGEPQRRSASELLSSRGTSTLEPRLPALTAMSPFTHGPYPIVRPLPLELRRTDTSVPGLMQDVGSLHVANLVAGDILTSGDESSRPPTALDDVGTPRESSTMFKPRYLSLNGSGLDVPWIQMPPAVSGPGPGPGPMSGPESESSVPTNHNRWKERLERSSAKPAEEEAQDLDLPSLQQQQQQHGTIEAWRDSLRNNIATALGAFTSAVSVPARPSVTAYTWQHPITSPSAAAAAAVVVARAQSTASTMSKPWTLEETRDGAGIVHIRSVPDDPAHSSHSSTGNSTGIDSGRKRRKLPPTPAAGRRLSPPPLASLVPPRLPHFPPMPHVPRTSSNNSSSSSSTRRQHGSRRHHGHHGHRTRRSLVRRSSSSAASSATSVGSDMSRASGSRGSAVVRWARLSEKEEAARRALRQRRLRSIGSVRKRTSRGV